MSDVQMVLCFMLAWKNDDAAMHAMLALTRRGFSAGLAWDVSVKLKHSLSFDHDPSDPRISYGEQEEQPDYSTGTEGQELDAEGEGQEHAGGEDIDGPFESHEITLYSKSSTFLLRNSCSHTKRRRVHVHIAVFHHLPHLLVQLPVAAHAFHHLARPVPLTDEFPHVLFTNP